MKTETSPHPPLPELIGGPFCSGSRSSLPARSRFILCSSRSRSSRWQALRCGSAAASGLVEAGREGSAHRRTGYMGDPCDAVPLRGICSGSRRAGLDPGAVHLVSVVIALVASVMAIRGHNASRAQEHLL